MHIAGGLYQELCEVPAWNKTFGSGGRAAAAIIEISPAPTLHTFVEDHGSLPVQALEALGVNIIAHRTTVRIAISYFHPLSRPLITPKLGSFANDARLTVKASNVLRFGMLEGSAVVTAKRAVYDPQTSLQPEQFESNGSTAESLAVVLNEDEVRAMGGRDSVEEASEELLTNSLADVVVVKRGSKGVVVCEAGTQIHLPAYKSPSVFKIGTGDIFSAVFAVHWAERNCVAAQAADLASRAVAHYAGSVQLPLPAAPTNVYPELPRGTPGIILLDGSIITLGERYILEEARYCLRMLGANVVCPQLDGASTEDNPISAVLLCADGYDENTTYLLQLAERGTNIVVFSEKNTQSIPNRLPAGAKVSIVSDFTTAVYHTYWASVLEQRTLADDNG